ncbi:hypothetical protein TNCV_2236531 [Trichonephila clavipes]|nr:hypothetical protein TNCV_2236531 [Trichonephila clavipes]
MQIPNITKVRSGAAAGGVSQPSCCGSLDSTFSSVGLSEDQQPKKAIDFNLVARKENRLSPKNFTFGNEQNMENISRLRRDV